MHDADAGEVSAERKPAKLEGSGVEDVDAAGCDGLCMTPRLALVAQRLEENVFLMRCRGFESGTRNQRSPIGTLSEIGTLPDRL